jgi:hypothetical protein
MTQAANLSGTGICRAWVNINGASGASPTIRAAFNVASVTRNSTGSYTITFTTAMSDANYSWTIGGWNNGTGNGAWIAAGTGSGSYPTGVTTSALSIIAYSNAGSVQDQDAICIAVFR